MTSVFNINNDEFVKYTNKLEKMHRAALPTAIRGTLNGLALDVKKHTMPVISNQEFTNRQKNFFKSQSKINFARGFNINSMKSEIGFSGKSQAISDLESQEHGGVIKGRAFIPTDKSRVSNSKKKNVRKKNRTSSIRNVIRTTKSMPLPKAVNIAGVGGHVLHEQMLFSVKSISKRTFNLTAIYSYKSGRSVSVKATHFMRRATLKTIKKAPKIWKKEAEKSFERYFFR